MTTGALLCRAARRRAMYLAYWNAGLWAVGNGLTSTTLIVYLAQEFGAKGAAVGLIVAAPLLVGALRLSAPALIEQLGDRRRFCVLSYLASTLLLLLLPVLSAPGVLPSAAHSLTALVALCSAYHLFEYCGAVALWSWLVDISPLRIRGRFIAISGIFYGLSSFAGGVCFDALGEQPWGNLLDSYQIDRFRLMFLVGLVGRLLGVVLLLWIIEPGAKSLWQFLFGRRAS